MIALSLLFTIVHGVNQKLPLWLGVLFAIIAILLLGVPK
jgi:hypothetical protein